MNGGVLELIKGIPTRIEEGGARQGLAYAWWIPVFCATATVTLSIIALVQRDALLPPRPVVIATVVVVAVFIIEFTTRKWMPWWMTTALLTVAVVWLMADASNVSPALDMAPAILAFVGAQITATDGVLKGTLVTCLSVALVAAFGFDGRVVHLLEILVGLIVGCVLRWQMRALVAERDARAGERERATLAERQRIAREIHDLVGHSLSVTLLHVTGARRALTEDEDVDEAVDALRDAERIGRAAMADIRRTVGVLAEEPAAVGPLPNATDVDDLIKDVRAAGIEVTYDSCGDLASLPSAAGLGIYRVAQESLANVAKHAPSSPVHMRLDVRDDRACLRVDNPLPDRNASVGSGSGLTGMAARAEQLGGACRTGPADNSWVVELVVPVAGGTAQVTDAGDETESLVRKVLP